MTKIISLFNQCGGQGKTTLTFNLGYHFAEAGAKVLLVDLDAQGSLTRFTGQKLKDDETSIFEALLRQEPFSLIKDVHGMDVVGADRRMYRLDLIIGTNSLKAPALLLKKSLTAIKSKYDVILLDCPPALGMASVNALLASTHVLIPIETAIKGLEGVEALFATIKDAEKLARTRIKIAGVIPMHFDRRIKTSTQCLEAISKFSKQMSVYPAIANRSAFDYAWAKRIPVAKYDPKCDAVPAFKEIIQGVERL